MASFSSREEEKFWTEDRSRRDLFIFYCLGYSKNKSLKKVAEKIIFSHRHHSASVSNSNVLYSRQNESRLRPNKAQPAFIKFSFSFYGLVFCEFY